MELTDICVCGRNNNNCDSLIFLKRLGHESLFRLSKKIKVSSPSLLSFPPSFPTGCCLLEPLLTPLCGPSVH